MYAVVGIALARNISYQNNYINIDSFIELFENSIIKQKYLCKQTYNYLFRFLQLSANMCSNKAKHLFDSALRSISNLVIFYCLFNAEIKSNQQFYNSEHCLLNLFISET